MPIPGAYQVTPRRTARVTFTPAAGFSGPIDIVYTACDNATPANCAIATLHILVDPSPVISGDIAVTVPNTPLNGTINSIYFTQPGSGYITTPTISVVDANSTPGTGATLTVAGETSNHGGPAAVRYVTKKVVLDPGFDSGDLNVYLTAYRPVNTDIQVYYKILNRNDTQKFEDGSWQLMTKTNNCDSKYSQSRDDLIEYTFAPGTNGVDQGYISYTSKNGQTYTTFSQFAIKVVMTTSDKTTVPFASDMRTIALPSNVNTTF